ncbi:MupG family TIM beta-alpha barrel fold protein [Psychrilyobacter atlanticus]|uniref:MupG family TIM beta-alpha barrel fold protein n=1 Tax=Psychrilyobacter atlanticus TaxID=271091 RepID=UPI0004257A43|nr:MupG family TIM beta-alpha barrel fold protein [Psychrilyobacter atlanticus]
MIGISVFPGMDMEIEENIKYMKRAKENGVEIVFTSMHIPEADEERILFEFEKILKQTNELNMKLIVDISKKYIEKYKWEDYNIFALRLDFGFSDEEIVRLSKKYPIQLNASTVSEEWMENLMKMGLDSSKITVCHNYYPRKDTGISIELLRRRNKYYKSLGMEIMGFISSDFKKRGPVYEGLPTVEAHRGLHPIVGAQELLGEGCDLVIVGDLMASKEELLLLGKLDRDSWLLPVKKYEMSLGEEEIFNILHKNRMDPGDFLIRCEKSRGIFKDPIKKNNIIDRKPGSVTIDNIGYERYSGELQICQKDFPSDERVNVVAQILDDERLIQRIGEGDKFRFCEV